MAGPLVVVAGEAASSAAARAGASAVGAKVKDWLVQIGLWEAVQYAADNAPDLLSNIGISMGKSNLSPDQAAATQDGGRKVALVELAKAGVTIAPDAGLTRAEFTKYAKLLKDFGTQLQNKVDSAQIARDSEDDFLARAQYNQSMASACRRLGLTGPNRFRDLYRISLIMNTIKESDVEKAELHERVYGPI